MRRRVLLTALLALVTAGASLLWVHTASAEPAPNGFQYCVNGTATDPDRDGWGWENNASCVVRGGAADGAASGGGGTAPGGFPYCASSASDPDGDGWGWENNRSCQVRPGTGGGSTGGGSTGGGSTAACPSGATCGSYTVSGLGARKNAIRAAGGDALDVAVAMLETERMDTNYVYGDNKRDDASNFGVFKQNWFMLRNACSRFRGQTTAQWNNGAALNSNLSADVQCLNASQSFYGIDRWFAGHRNGQTGVNNPNTSDIARYKTAIYWMRDRLNSNSANLSNDTRFWVNVPAI